MKQALNVFRYEFLRYFNTPVAFVYLMAFLLLNGSCAFYLGYFLERGVADLNPMFFYMPWLFLFFIPAISMRLFAEEYKSNTIYQTLSLPVSIASLTVGKFLAAWAFCVLGIVLTFEFWISLNIIASPDNGVIFSAYVASVLLAGALVSVALFASSITKNQVIALIIGISLILFFYLSGLDFVLGFFKMFLSTEVVDMFASFSVLTHYSTTLLGIFEAKVVVFFVSIILFFVYLTILSVKAKFNPQRNYKILALISLIGFIGLNLVFLPSTSFVDNTVDKRFSLSHSTKDILLNLDDNVNAKLYYSQELSNQNPRYRELFNTVKNLLKQYQEASNGKFDLQIIYPTPLSKEEDMAIANGLKGMPIIDSSQNAFFGLVLTDALDNKQVIELFSPQKQSFLEVLITQKIYLLGHKKQTIGVITGLDMFENVVGGVATQNWQVVEELKDFYNIKKIDNDNPKIEGISALVIAAPMDLSDDLVKNILEYKNNGGNFLILLDPAPEAVRLFAPQTKELKATDFTKLEKEFGFEFLHEVFAADLDNSLTVDATIDYTQNPIITQDVAQILLKDDNINQAYSPTHGLKEILLSSASILAPVDDEKFEFMPLLITSKNSALMSSDYLYYNVNPARVLANFKKDQYKKILAAKIVSKNDKNPFKAIVVADSDFLYDAFLNSSDNLYLVLNSLDELTSNHRLLTLRAKSNKIYRLTKIEELRKKAQLDYTIKEAELLEKINVVKVKIQEIISKKAFEERAEFVADELAMIAKLRKNLEASKNELGELKQSSYQELESYNNLLKLINIYLLPLIILLVVVIKYYRVSAFRQKSKIVFDKKTSILIGISLTLFVGGVLLNTSFEDKKVDKIVFDNLEVIKVDKIVITKDNKTLELYKDDDKWQIQGRKGFVVYQARVKNLLTAISFAKYYEEKSNKIKNLPYFGLGDKEKTNIKLYSGDKETANFDIGKYDIDLGRGGRGAYYKPSENFDVWLINADLIDVTPNWREFSYSLLWDLRFGRVVGMSAEEVKEMINTPLLEAFETIKKPKKVFGLDIKTDKNPVKIDFYKSNGEYFVKYNFNPLYYKIEEKDYKRLKKSIKNT